MADKIRLLAVSDWADTGFGRVMKELLPRLAATGLFEIEMVAWAWDLDMDEYDRVLAAGVRLHFARGRWGKDAVGIIAPKFKPEIVLSLGDPWMVSWIADLGFRDSFRWVAYVPIDREPVSKSWATMLSKPDVLVLYSEFGMRVVGTQMPFRHPVLVPHGVDSTVFRPMRPMERRAARASLQVEEDAWIVGTVARNQERKQIPLLFAAFKAFNCVCRSDPAERNPEGVEDDRLLAYSCPSCGNFRQDPEKASSKLYVHMTMGDGKDPDDGNGVSWNVPELVTRWGVKGRVLATPNYSVKKGLASDRLNVVYNLFDVHLLTTKREGFCLPQLEAMSAGIPTVGTDCTALSELLRAGKGFPARVAAWVNEPHWEADGAICDPLSAADGIEEFFRSPERRAEAAEAGRAYAVANDWSEIVSAWIPVLCGAVGRPIPGTAIERPIFPSSNSSSRITAILEAAK